jgi:endonuclease/exonuclease/phosphatase family metal-dependent hydrolase
MTVRVRPDSPAKSFLLARLAAIAWCLLLLPGLAAAQEIVLYASDVGTMRGNWTRVDSSSAAGGRLMRSQDHGWATTDVAHASPANYYETSFTAQAGTSYRVWLRLRAIGNSKWNDSVWVQFSDSLDSNGHAVYRIGTASALLFNLEACNNCGMSGWGWSGGAWWVNQQTTLRFASSGTKTVRVQIREDGVEVDQIVLSASTYRNSAPGSTTNDSTILPRNTGEGSSPASSVHSIVGTIEAEDFDAGANGTAYRDTTAGNSGGQYRSTDVDIERCSEGGYNVGWIAAGEWLNYTVNVPSSGTYTLAFRVASPSGGGQLRALFNGDDKTGGVAIPATGGWQAWTTVSRTVTLSAGTQVMRLVVDSPGFNLNWVRGSSGGTTSESSGSGSTTSTPFGGTPWAIPGTIQAVDFDNGGQNVAYRDNTPGNTGGAYRATDVDIAAIPSGGFTVGWVGAGEWLQYTVNVAAAGQYTLTARVASNGGGGTFHVKFNGADLTGSLRVPNTGGWSTYQDVTATVSLNAGVQVMRLSFDSDGSSGAVGNFASLRLSSGTSSSTTSSSTTSSGGTFRVMTWNIDQTRDPAGQTREIANSGADVVLLQEAAKWTEDVTVTFPQRLQQLTGHTWTAVWASHFNRYSELEGTMILTRLPVVAQSIRRVHDRGFTRVLVSVGGVHVNVLNAHLDWYDTSKRTAQLEDFMWWGRQFSGPRIAGGDFNAWWGEWWIKRMTEEHTDTWVDVKGTNEGGYTLNGAVRFDYLFRAHTDNWRVTPTAIWVRSTSLSDHAPVIADYTVR